MITLSASQEERVNFVLEKWFPAKTPELVLPLPVLSVLTCRPVEKTGSLSRGHESCQVGLGWDP